MEYLYHIINQLENIEEYINKLNEDKETYMLAIGEILKVNILKEDNLTDYIKDKYKDIDLKVRNENGNVFLNKDVIYVILKELEENNQVVYENGKFNLR